MHSSSVASHPCLQYTAAPVRYMKYVCYGGGRYRIGLEIALLDSLDVTAFVVSLRPEVD